MTDVPQHSSLETIQNISATVRINADGSILHKTQGNLGPPEELLGKLNALSPDLQLKFLSIELRNHLYRLYFLKIKSPLATAETPLESSSLQNRIKGGRKSEFYRCLDSSNVGNGYMDEGWVVLAMDERNRLAVSKQGLTLWIEREKYLEKEFLSSSIGDIIPIRMPKNLVESGFYVAVGDTGFILPTQNSTQLEMPCLTVYLNFRPVDAPQIMEHLTEQLNAIKLPFALKMTYDSSRDDFCHPGRLHLAQANYDAAKVVLKSFWQTYHPILRPDLPSFTKVLAPGIGLAEEPLQPLTAKDDFTLHRSQLIANGILTAWRQDCTSPKERSQAIIESFMKHGIDLECPYLNPGSQDRYDCLS